MKSCKTICNGIGILDNYKFMAFTLMVQNLEENKEIVESFCTK